MNTHRDHIGRRAGRRPRLLDLYSCAGGAARGYQRAGFHVTGVDIAPQPRYAGDVFVQADALDYLAAHWSAFDAVHASPPCQKDCTLTAGTNAHRGVVYPDLLDATRDGLEATGLPYVIEQPPGRATRRMRVDIRLCGEMFELAVIRHRNFELGSWTMPQPPHRPHRGRVAGMRHGRWYTGPYFQVYGEGGGKGTVPQWQAAMGIDWTDICREIAEAIPPAYTHHIGHALHTALTIEGEVAA